LRRIAIVEPVFADIRHHKRDSGAEQICAPPSSPIV
jgi:hypothetical protein